MAKHILVVDDDALMRRSLSFNLEQAGFKTSTADSAEAALALIQRDRPDLILLDIGLPGMDGLDALRHVQLQSDIPIIFVTARRRELDQALGLELGADDYVTKPFSPKELVARALAIFRRVPGRTEPARVLKDGNLVVEPEAHQATLNGQLLDLTPNEFAVLATLLAHRGQALSRGQLIELALGHDYDGQERTVDVYVRHVRRKIEADPANPQRITTVFGVGYRYET